MRYRLWLAPILVSGLLLATAARSAGEFEIIDVPAATNKDVYFQINVSGKVYLRLVAENGGEACADFWWIKWPLGTVEKLGRHCGSAQFTIPTFFSDFAVSSKLRVGGANTHLKIAASDSIQVSSNATVTFP